MREEAKIEKKAEAEEVEELKQQILSSNTTEEALALLEKQNLRRKAGAVIAGRIRRQIDLWTDGRLSMDVVVFSSELGVLGEAGEGG